VGYLPLSESAAAFCMQRTRSSGMGTSRVSPVGHYRLPFYSHYPVSVCD
jgi:hypothetical protein